MTIVTDEMCNTFRSAWHAKLGENAIREGLEAVLQSVIEWGVLYTTETEGERVSTPRPAESFEDAHAVVESGPIGNEVQLQLIRRTLLNVGGQQYVGEWEGWDHA